MLHIEIISIFFKNINLCFFLLLNQFEYFNIINRDFRISVFYYSSIRKIINYLPKLNYIITMIIK